jgi:hypothetical protein
LETKWLGCFLYKKNACGLAYEIQFSEDWLTLSAIIDGHIGRNRNSIKIDVNEESWFKDEKEISSVEGCVDIDLGFSPSTNLLPIKRLGLEVGESKKVDAAWLKFPDMKLLKLKQIYTRKTLSQYSYDSYENDYSCLIETNNAGFVTYYPGFWREENAA